MQRQRPLLRERPSVAEANRFSVILAHTPDARSTDTNVGEVQSVLSSSMTLDACDGLTHIHTQNFTAGGQLFFSFVFQPAQRHRRNPGRVCLLLHPGTSATPSVEPCNRAPPRLATADRRDPTLRDVK